MDVKLRHRVTALVVMALLALTLTGAAWWALQDGTDDNDWLIRAIRAANVLLLSKTGVKGLLLLLVAAAAGGMWLRSRRRRERRDSPLQGSGSRTPTAGDPR